MMYSVISVGLALSLRLHASAPVTPVTSAASVTTCAEVRDQLKARFDKIPAALRRLGGEHHASRRYLNEPKNYLEDGVSTACKGVAATGDLRAQLKLECPQVVNVTFRFPSAMARDPKSAAPIDTVYISLMYSSMKGAPHLEMPMASFTFTDDGFTAEAPGRHLSLKKIDDQHAYLEWTQKAEVMDQQAQRVLIDVTDADADFERAVPALAECR